MNEKQALDILKAALDLATSKGVFTTLNDSAAVIEAFNVIAKHFEPKKDDTKIHAAD